MKLYINGSFFAERLTGVQRFSIETLKQIDIALNEDKYKQVNASIFVPLNCTFSLDFKNIKVKKVKLLEKNFGEQLFLPWYSRKGFLLNLASRAPLFKKNQTLVIHDASIRATPDRFSKKFVIMWGIIYYILGKVLKRIITVSNFSKGELCKYFHMSENKIEVVYEGFDHILEINPDYQYEKNLNLKNRKYILAVGGTKNKNFSLIMRMLKYDIKDLEIVIAGKIDEKYLKVLKSEKRVNCVGYVSNEELVALYKNAWCFLYPSTYEGFGIPPLEAMGLDVPVIVSHAASLPEVCGNNVLYCDPNNEVDLYKKITLLIENDMLREKLKINGKKHVKKFVWRTTATMILDTVLEDQK